MVNYVENCELIMCQFRTQVKLKVLLLGSYNVLIGMDWLEKQQVILNFTCLIDKGERITVTEIPRKTFARQISSLQIKNDVRKGCKVFFVHIINNEQIGKEDKPGIEDILILQDFMDVLSEKILGLPPKRDLDFTIELVPGAVPNSKAPN